MFVEIITLIFVFLAILAIVEIISHYGRKNYEKSLYVTNGGYRVAEHVDGLYVYQNHELVCFLHKMYFDDFRVDKNDKSSIIDDKKLESEIKENTKKP